MKKKYTIIFVLFCLICFASVNLLYLSGNLNYLKNKLPQSYKEILKNSIFYFSYLKKKNEILTKYSNELNLKNVELEFRLNTLEQEKNLVNEVIFPQTQFLKFDYTQYDLTKINLEKKELYIGSEFVSPFYLENLDDNLFIVSKSGNIHQIFLSNLNSENLEFKKINTNIDQNIEITDTLIFEKKFYIVAHRKNKDCKNIIVYFAEINEQLDNLKFKKFFEYGASGLCDRPAFAGRIASYEFKGQKGFLVSSISFNDINKKILDQYGYRLEYKFSDLLFIDYEKKNYIRFATGFKNPQGLLVVDKNILLSDHGPRGGDEINKIDYEKNYGWPYSSYGEDYFKSMGEIDEYKYFKSHYDKGFEEPVFAWVPSIAPSQLIKIDKNFSEKWQESILLSSLKGQSLYRLSFDKNYSKIITFERIRIKKRIRDLIYIPSKKIIILAQENDNGSLGIIKNNE